MFSLNIKRRFTCLQLLKFYSKKSSKETLAKRKEKYGNEFPEKLLTKKSKTPSYMYIANEEAVQIIEQNIEPYLRKSKCNTFLEMNPGIGLFTKKLLDKEQFRKIILIESMDHFLPHLQEMHFLYPERVKLRQGDIVNMWKLAYQDKMDNGTRVSDLMVDVPRKPFKDVEPNMIMFGGVGSYNFFKHLINSLVFQYSLLTLGRCELYLVVPPPIFIHLTCTNDIGYMIYRSTSILFQIMFEHRFITAIPREHFLPWQRDFALVKGSKLGRVKSINPEYLYLVRIVPRRNLYELCDIEDLPALWYFVKQNCVSRRNRVIPNMEKWVPGCGPRLIVNKQKSVPVKRLYSNENIERLPKFSSPCTTMSNEDFYYNFNIYTQFGDLTASQMLTLFRQFRSWPEYSESSFLASLESTLLKMESSADDTDEVVDLPEEDDVGSEPTSLGEENYIEDEDSKIERNNIVKRFVKTSL